MTKEDLAAALDCCEYRSELPKILEHDAKTSGLVVVFGASDDLLELRGAIHDEVGCWNGGSFLIDKEGILPSWEQVCEDGNEQLAEKYFVRKRHVRLVKAVWSQGEYSWQYETAIPHAAFDVLEDGDKYCRGIIFSLEDL